VQRRGKLLPGLRAVYRYRNKADPGVKTDPDKKEARGVKASLENKAD